MKEENTLSTDILEEFKKLPSGEKINACIQCGTCAGSCPVSNLMDLSPRRAIAKLKAGEIEDVLTSNTAWLCASCYSCTVRCPSKIKITDFMYHLKRTAEKHGYKPKNKAALRMAKHFNAIVSKYGRSYEPELMIRSNITTPFNLLKLAPFGLKLFMKNRMPIFPARIKGAKYIKRAMKGGK